MVENRIFSYPLHSSPLLGGPHQNIAITFGMGKLEWCGYGDADGEKSSRWGLFSRFGPRATDRKTEMLPQHSLRYAQHRAVTTILQT